MRLTQSLASCQYPTHTASSARPPSGAIHHNLREPRSTAAFSTALRTSSTHASFVLCLLIRWRKHSEDRKRDQRTSATAPTSTLRIYNRLTNIKLENVLTPNHVTETFLGLKNNELKQQGEYRTHRLVLEARDKINL